MDIYGGTFIKLYVALKTKFLFKGQRTSKKKCVHSKMKPVQKQLNLQDPQKLVLHSAIS